MNKPAVIQLRLPRSIKQHVERWAKLDGTSMNQLIASAVAEKLSALETAEFFESRARRADAGITVTLASIPKRSRETPLIPNCVVRHP